MKFTINIYKCVCVYTHMYFFWRASCPRHNNQKCLRTRPNSPRGTKSAWLRAAVLGRPCVSRGPLEAPTSRRPPCAGPRPGRHGQDFPVFSGRLPGACPLGIPLSTRPPLPQTCRGRGLSISPDRDNKPGGRETWAGGLLLG